MRRQSYELSGGARRVPLFYQGNKRRLSAHPDGDSIWFKPQSKQHLANLDDRNVEFYNGGFVQLGFEGIDALELHADVLLPDGTNVNRTLVKEGWSWWYRKYAPGGYGAGRVGEGCRGCTSRTVARPDHVGDGD